MAEHHILISGTGRAGTTFLVQLLTELGLDTGFSSSSSGIHPNCQAGMEHSGDCLLNGTAPYVVKSPGLSEKLELVLESTDVKIDLLIISVRDLFSAAESRRRVSAIAKNPKAPGGLSGTKKPGRQEAVLAEKFYRLVYTAVKHQVPTVYVYFPRIVKDPEYLYESIRPALLDTEYPAFLRAFEKVSRPELVHRFEKTQHSGLLGTLLRRSKEIFGK